MRRLLFAVGTLMVGWTLLRLAIEMSAPRHRCSVCGKAVDKDPLDVEAICPWHWAQGGDA